MRQMTLVVANEHYNNGCFNKSRVTQSRVVHRYAHLQVLLLLYAQDPLRVEVLYM